MAPLCPPVEFGRDKLTEMSGVTDGEEQIVVQIAQSPTPNRLSQVHKSSLLTKKLSHQEDTWLSCKDTLQLNHLCHLLPVI